MCVCVCVEDGYSPTTMVLYDMGLEFCEVLKIGIFQCTMSVGDRVPACICLLQILQRNIDVVLVTCWISPEEPTF